MKGERRMNKRFYICHPLRDGEPAFGAQIAHWFENWPSSVFPRKMIRISSSLIYCQKVFPRCFRKYSQQLFPQAWLLCFKRTVKQLSNNDILPLYQISSPIFLFETSRINHHVSKINEENSTIIKQDSSLATIINKIQFWPLITSKSMLSENLTFGWWIIRCDRNSRLLRNFWPYTSKLQKQILSPSQLMSPIDFRTFSRI